MTAKWFMEMMLGRKCVVCNKSLNIRTIKEIKNDTYVDGLCEKCRKKIKYVTEPKCAKCGRPLEDEVQEYCMDCTKGKHIYDRGMAVFTYEEGIKESIYRFKYKNHKIYGEFFGDEMAEKYGKWLKNMEIDAIIPVPVHKERMRKRGYNQAELIARRLSNRIDIKMDEYMLTRMKKTRPQKELGVSQRKKNLEKAFKVCGNIVKYKKIVLVDDIYTTGSTIDECARVLKEAGVEEVYFLALCIGQGV